MYLKCRHYFSHLNLNFSGQSTCRYSVCSDIFHLFSDKHLRQECSQYKDIRQQINTGDTHPLKQGATSKTIYSSIFSPEHSGISDQLELINKVTQDQRDGKHALSEDIVPLIFMGSAEDNFAFHFIYEDKEEGTSKVVGSFTIKMGYAYNEKQAKIWFRIGYFGTATPSSDGYNQKDNLPHSTYEKICTRDHFIHQASKKKNATESQQKSFIDSEYQKYLEKGTEMEKDTFNTWIDNYQYRETQQE